MSQTRRSGAPSHESPAKTQVATVVEPSLPQQRSDSEHPTAAALRVEANRLRDQGVALASEAVDPWWRSCADRAVEFLAAQGEPFTADDVTGLVGMPDHPNAVGARINAAQRAGLIHPVGFVMSRRPSRHSGVVRLWRGTRHAVLQGQAGGDR